MINARSETAATKPAFRDPLTNRRCLIPADGFYEWSRRGKAKQPYCFEVNDGELFAFAGLWDRWRDPNGQWIKSCSILTTTPNAVTATVHDRCQSSLIQTTTIWARSGNDQCRGGAGNVQALQCPTDEVLPGQHADQSRRQLRCRVLGTR
jgi:putative SOS response-associated peptidase YedK